MLVNFRNDIVYLNNTDRIGIVLVRFLWFALAYHLQTHTGRTNFMETIGKSMSFLANESTTVFMGLRVIEVHDPYQKFELPARSS